MASDRQATERVPADATEHAGIYAYSDGFDLWLFRCPSCGSTGPRGSGCKGHDAPLAMNTMDEYLVPRVAVKVEFPGESYPARVAEAIDDLRETKAWHPGAPHTTTGYEEALTDLADALGLDGGGD